MSLAGRVLGTVRKFEMLPEGGRVVVALSGGPDSVALVLLLRELEQAARFVVAGLAHLNHGLRPTAGDDEAFCRALADDLGLEFRAETVDVRAVARRRRSSVEDAGRAVRYEFFLRVARELRADRVATGHTRDDQAETFLLRLIRGAGPRGLAGIHPVAGAVIRPVLEVGRDELREYLAARGQAFCEDETNQDVTIPRNRIRHELIPYIQREFSPGIVKVLAHEAMIARLDEAHLEREAIDSANSIVLSSVSGARATRAGLDGVPDLVRSEPGLATDDAAHRIGVPGRRRGPRAERVEIDRVALTSLPPAIAPRVARAVLAKVAPDRFVGFEDLERFLAFAAGCGPGSGLSLPGQHAARRGDRVQLTPTAFRGFANSFRVPLSIPGEVTLETQGWAVSAQPLEADVWAAGSWAARSDSVAVGARALRLPLAVRSRRPGDRFRPLGLGGRGKKLQDLLVDRKVAREQRDALPLVVDDGDRIVWVVGESVAEDFRVTEPSQGVILLKARRLGGPG